MSAVLRTSHTSIKRPEPLGPGFSLGIAPPGADVPGQNNLLAGLHAEKRQRQLERGRPAQPALPASPAQPASPAAAALPAAAGVPPPPALPTYTVAGPSDVELQASRVCSSRPEVDSGVDPSVIQQLQLMGFTPVQVKAAACRLGGGAGLDADMILDALLSSAEAEPQEEALAEPEGEEACHACDDPLLAAFPPMPAELERNLSDGSQKILAELTVQRDGGGGEVDIIAGILRAMAKASWANLLTPEQREMLNTKLKDRCFDEAFDIVEGVGVPALAEVVAGSDPHRRRMTSWECSICFSDQSSSWFGWACPEQHRFCTGCMRHHVDAVPFPRCPSVGCTYELTETDLSLLHVEEARIEAFRRAKLQNAVDTMAHPDETLLRCSAAACSNVVLLPRGSERQAFRCHCGAPAFCTGCRQHPYHYHSSCDLVQPLREQWLAWVSGGREAYHGRTRAAEEGNRRNQALRDALARHEEMERDEKWKAANCRLCPNCSRPISKVDGCDSMVCGRAYHGGDEQPGCGESFDWSRAQPYTVQVSRRALPTMSREHMGLRGRGAFHPFAHCCLCGSGRQGISGLRFRCIHCEAFDVCGECEPKLGELHDPQHVFEIMFESGFDWGSVGPFPVGTRVRIVRQGAQLPRSLVRCSVEQLEGTYGVVQGKRRGPLPGYKVELDLGQGAVELAVEHLEPLLASSSEAADLLAKMMDPGQEEQAVQAVDTAVLDPGLLPPAHRFQPQRRAARAPPPTHLYEDPLSDDSLSD